MKSPLDQEIDELECRIQDLERKVAELRRQRPATVVQDYALVDSKGSPVRLQELFGDSREMLLVHNMGRACSYCTLWADGFNGMLPHLRSRAPFVVVSPDEPAVQREFAESRGWTFPMVSAHGTTLFDDMGFRSEDGGFMPGVSGLERTETGEILWRRRAEFGPGDAYCPVWHLFELLPGGVGGWEPKFDYDATPAT